MAWKAVAICPTSSVRPACSGSCVRASMLRLTCSAAADSRRIGPATVRASSSEVTTEASSAMRGQHQDDDALLPEDLVDLARAASTAAARPARR